MRYGLAIVACIGIFFVYGLIGAALGWRHGGGVIPIMILLAILGATWRGITKGGQAKTEKPEATSDE